MKKSENKSAFRRFLLSPVTTVLAFAAAAGLLLTSGIGGARAALTYFSETYTQRVTMYDIGVTLQENGVDVAYRDYNSSADGTWNEAEGILLTNMLAEGEDFKLGVAYPEAISVRNSGNINQYVRVTIYKYWLDKDGNKMQTLSPDLINLHMINIGTDWILDPTASTAERTVVYYKYLLNAGEHTSPMSDTLSVSNALAAKVTQTTKKEGNKTTITTTYDYDGVSFHIVATCDAVQEHNAAPAIESAWGTNVTVNNKQVTLR